MIGFLYCLFRRLILKKEHEYETISEYYDEWDEEYKYTHRCVYCGHEIEETQYESLEEHKEWEFYMKYSNYDY